MHCALLNEKTVTKIHKIFKLRAELIILAFSFLRMNQGPILGFQMPVLERKNEKKTELALCSTNTVQEFDIPGNHSLIE